MPAERFLLLFADTVEVLIRLDLLPPR